MEPTAITHEKKGKWSEPNLHEDMFQPLIFRSVRGDGDEVISGGLLLKN